MAEKKNKRSFDNWKSTITWIASVMSILIILFFAIEHKSQMPLKAVAVDIVTLEDQKQIITEDMILDKLKTYLGYEIDAANINDLSLVEVEHLIKSDDRVKTAEVYIDGAEQIHIEVWQRTPVLRVFSDSGESYYLDTEGRKINKIQGVAARVPIVTGRISAYREDLLSAEYTGTLRGAYDLAMQVREDKFLLALIEQIHIDDHDEMILIPKLGDEKIAFGGIEDSDERLENIKEFYEHGLPSVGWSKYHTLKFKYKNALFAERKK